MALSHCTLPSAVTIVAVQQENYRTKTFVLDATLAAEPGQFVMLWLPRFDEKPFSLVSADPVTIMVTAVGPFTRLLHECRPGARIWMRGPFGHGFAVPATQRHIALVGGGYGVAPLLWLAHTQSGSGRQVSTLIGVRTSSDLLYTERFHRLDSAPSGHSLIVTTEDGSAGVHGRVTTALEPMLQASKIDGIYACGPHGMLAALEALAVQHRVSAQLSWEAYMRCAVGICGACEHAGRVLCLDGPVLSSAG